jgi:hypothetical protein
MAQDMIEKKYPKGDAPELIFSNEKTTVSIVAGYTQNAHLTLEQLPQFKEFMEKNFERNTSELEWISRGIKDINGRKMDIPGFSSKRC